MAADDNFWKSFERHYADKGTPKIDEKTAKGRAALMESRRATEAKERDAAKAAKVRNILPSDRSG